MIQEVIVCKWLRFLWWLMYPVICVRFEIRKNWWRLQALIPKYIFWPRIEL